MSDQIAATLAERARAGVEVRVLLDAFGSLTLPGDTVRSLEAAGVKVATFRPLRFGKLTRYHKRNHRRAIVIDGTVGFTGGRRWRTNGLGNADDEELKALKG